MTRGFDVSGEGITVSSEGVDIGVAIQITVTSTVVGESVTLRIREDTDNDDTYEASETFTLSGGTEDFVPSNLSLGSGTNVEIRVENPDDGTITDAAEISEIKFKYQ